MDTYKLVKQENAKLYMIQPMSKLTQACTVLTCVLRFSLGTYYTTIVMPLHMAKGSLKYIVKLSYVLPKRIMVFACVTAK